MRLAVLSVIEADREWLADHLGLDVFTQKYQPCAILRPTATAEHDGWTKVQCTAQYIAFTRRQQVEWRAKKVVAIAGNLPSPMQAPISGVSSAPRATRHFGSGGYNPVDHGSNMDCDGQSQGAIGQLSTRLPSRPDQLVGTESGPGEAMEARGARAISISVVAAKRLRTPSNGILHDHAQEFAAAALVLSGIRKRATIWITEVLAGRVTISRRVILGRQVAAWPVLRRALPARSLIGGAGGCVTLLVTSH